MTHHRPYIVAVETSQRKAHKRTYAYDSNAMIEARRLAQETMRPVRVYKREGKSLILLDTMDPKDERTMLTDRKRKLEEELDRVNHRLGVLEDEG